jgi:nucleotide-binding universal stress UspA family protein
LFETIVVGTNWSETADAALARAIELARVSGARLHVVSANAPGPRPVASGAAAGRAHADTGRVDFQADVALEGTLERLGAQELDVSQHALTADPAEAILAVAEQTGADLIVVGNKGMHRRVLGSIPNTVSHRARCDVFIVQTT